MNNDINLMGAVLGCFSCMAPLAIVGVVIYLITSSKSKRQAPDQKSFSSEQIIKYLAFYRIVDEFKNGDTLMTIRDLIPWTNTWIQPEWLLSYDPASTFITFYYGGDKERSNPVFSEIFLQFGKNNPISKTLLGKDKAEKYSLVESSQSILDELEIPEKEWIDSDEDTPSKFEKAFEEVIDLFKDKKPKDLSREGIKKLVKFLLFVNLSDMARIGQLNMASIRFFTWVWGWITPEWMIMETDGYKRFKLWDGIVWEDSLEKNSGDPEPLIEAPLFGWTDHPNAGRLFKDFSEIEISFLRDVTRKLGPYINPPEDMSSVDDKSLDYVYFFKQKEIIIPGVDALANRIDGSKSTDSGFQTKYHEIQACKMLISIILSNEIMQHMRKVANVPDKYVALACWCLYTLAPHWKLDIDPKYIERGWGDPKVSLYPLKINTGEASKAIFSGRFSLLISSMSPVLDHIQALDTNGKIAMAAQAAIEQYGKSVMMADGKNTIVGDGLIEVPHLDYSSENYRSIIDACVEHNDRAVDKILDQISK